MFDFPFRLSFITKALFACLLANAFAIDQIWKRKEKQGKKNYKSKIIAKQIDDENFYFSTFDNNFSFIWKWKEMKYPTGLIGNLILA